MTSKLAEIVEYKTKEVEQILAMPSLFKSVLKKGAIIAEIKRKSPSKGALAPIQDPVKLAEIYLSGGASALSILTDLPFFGGHLDDLKQVSYHLKHAPILRKDFILDKIQIIEAARAGAHAVLLIVTLLKEQTKPLLNFAKSLGLDALVEIHDPSELDIALSAGADIIGVNNRNLHTLEVDIHHALNMIDSIPPHLIKVAESGIDDPAIASAYFKAGYDAVLIGEALVKAKNPALFIKACRHESC